MLVTGTPLELFAESLGWQTQAEPPTPEYMATLAAFAHGQTVAELADALSISAVAVRMRLYRGQWQLLAPTVEAACWHALLVNLVFPIPPTSPPFVPTRGERRLLALVARGQSVERVRGRSPGTVRRDLATLRERCGAAHNGHMLALVAGWGWLNRVQPVWALPPDRAVWGEYPANEERCSRDPRRLPSDGWLDDLGDDG